jgi:hypothetical protein
MENNIVFSKDSEYWKLLDKVDTNDTWRSSVYSKLKSLYYQQRPTDDGKKLHNVSFLLQREEEVVVAFFGAMIGSNKKTDLLFYEAPCVLVLNKSKLTIKEKKSFLNEFDEILKQINGNIWYRDFTINGNVSFLTEHLLKKGATLVPKISKIINLSIDKDILWGDVRKRYKGLINKGLKEVKRYVLEEKTVTWEYMLKFRELHIQVSGRETRSIESWRMQFNLVKSGEAFLIFGELKGVLVTAGYFSYSKDNCIYGSSASRRDLFNQPIFHSIMWTAILYAKKIGCRWFEVGEQSFQYCYADIPITEKEIGISNFKAGFGGDSKAYLDVKLHQLMD